MLDPTIEDFTTNEAEAAYLSIRHNRKQYAKWAEAIDCLRVDSDLPEYRECFEVPSDLSATDAKVYILADMIESYYVDSIPCIESPYDAILLSGFNGINWMEVSRKLWEVVS